MGLYRKLPKEIEAFQFYIDKMPDWFMDKVTANKVTLYNCNYKRYNVNEAHCVIHTLRGDTLVNGGDYIIKGIKGEIYSCKGDIFEMTYEKLCD